MRRFALGLVADGLVHNVASDAHDQRSALPGLQPSSSEAGLGPLADWLTRAVPAAILSGEATTPPRPAVDLPACSPHDGELVARADGRFKRAW